MALAIFDSRSKRCLSFFQVLASQGEVGAIELDLLLRFPIQPNVVSPIDFITNNNWGAIRSLSQVDEFR